MYEGARTFLYLARAWLTSSRKGWEPSGAGKGTPDRLTPGCRRSTGGLPMCDDCVPSGISRRHLLKVPPAALAASLTAAVANPPPASAEQQTIDGICRTAWGAKPPTHHYTPQV